MGLGPKYLEDVKRLEASCNKAERSLWPPDRPRDNLIATANSVASGREILASFVVYAWRLHNIRHPRTRLALLALFGVGFILIGIPAVVTFLQVTLAGLRSWL